MKSNASPPTPPGVARRLAILPAALFALLLGVPEAVARVDAEVPGKVTVKGTATGEAPETYRFEAVAGSTLVLSVTTPRRRGADVTLRLYGPGDEDPITPDPARLTDRGFKIVLRGHALDRTGGYTVEVETDRATDYTFALTVRPPRPWSDQFTLDPGQDRVCDLSAAPGSAITLIAQAPRGSAAVPRIRLLEDQDLLEQGRRTARVHRVTLARGAAEGDFQVTCTNAGDVAGDVRLVAKFRAPRTRRRRFDVRDRVLGRHADLETFLARAVDEDGGTVTVEEFGTDLDGVSLEVPAGAVNMPTLLTIASDPGFALPDDDTQAAGPAIRLGPAGVQFDKTVLVTLTIDPARLPVDVDPDAIRVVRRAAGGVVEVLEPIDIDLEAGTLVVQVAAFSGFVPVVPRGPPQPAGQWWALGIEGNAYENDPYDSRARQVSIFLGDFEFLSTGTFTAQFEDRVVDIHNPDDGQDGVNGTVDSGIDAGSFAGTWAYRAGGQVIELEEAGQTPMPLWMAADGAMMLAGRPEPDGAAVEMNLVVRKPAIATSTAAVAGTWHMIGIEINAGETGPGTPARLFHSRFIGTMTFEAGGTASFTADYRDRDSQGGGTWTSDRDTYSASGTVDPEPGGTLRARLSGDEDLEDYRLFPCSNGQVMLGADRNSCGDCIFAFVLIRQGRGLGAGTLGGEHRIVVANPYFRSYLLSEVTPEPWVPDVWFLQSQGSATVLPGRRLALDVTDREISRDTDEETGLLVETRPSQVTLGFSITRTGRLTVTGPEGGPVVGAVTADGLFAVFIEGLGAPIEDNSLGAMLRLPETTMK